MHGCTAAQTHNRPDTQSTKIQQDITQLKHCIVARLHSYKILHFHSHKTTQLYYK